MSIKIRDDIWNSNDDIWGRYAELAKELQEAAKTHNEGGKETDKILKTAKQGMENGLPKVLFGEA